MSTAAQTWAAWDTNTWETLVDAANAAQVTYARDATDVAAKFTCGAKSITQTEYARKSGGGDTWETIFGVPSGATVTQVQVTAWKKKLVANTKLSSHSFIINLISDADARVTDADAISTSWGTGTDGSYAAQTAGSVVNVSASYQASNTPIRLSLEYTITTSGGGGSASVDIRFDDVEITVTYSVINHYTLALNGASKGSVGYAASLLADRTLVLGAGSASVQGQPVSLVTARLLALASASLGLSGADLALLADRLLGLEGAATGTQGQDLTLGRGKVLSLEGWSAGTAGSDLSFLYSRVFPLDAGAGSTVGAELGILRAAVLGLEGISAGTAGSALGLLVQRLLALASAAVGMQGGDSALLADRLLALEGRSGGSAGQAIELIYGGAGTAYTLVLEGSTLGAVFSPLGLQATRILALDASAGGTQGASLALSALRVLLAEGTAQGVLVSDLDLIWAAAPSVVYVFELEGIETGSLFAALKLRRPWGAIINSAPVSLIIAKPSGIRSQTNRTIETEDRQYVPDRT